ncbi:hypothetical protein FTUN_5251 [Frigoriglobus tundricola]|uniref:Uncharacterized protein n=1 Tax=Frigoriglobus tundricola TaxID=2774151 RepID=A0A6M5YW19_9BACT|nr:hypothetical protein FTUN_5251 [Frigoriglobus tundricola]
MGKMSTDYADSKTWKLSGDDEPQARLVHTPNEVREFLKIIFNAPATRPTLFSRIARSNEATAAVKGDVKPLEEPTPKPVSP